MRVYSAATTARIILSALMLLVATPVLVSSEAGHVVHTTPDGRVDWTTKVATATGVGYQPKDPNMDKEVKKEMAKKAAWGVALRNLLEVMRGVHVDSTTTVNNYITTNDEIRMKVEGFVQGASIIEEKWRSDGSYETTVKMEFGGEFSKLVIPKVAPQSTPLAQYQNKSQSAPISYTGLVVDARGFKVRPAAFPKLLNTAGLEVYSVAYVDQQAIPKGGIIIYVSDPQSAQKNPRVTSQPLFITAKGVQGADLIIGDSDAATVQANPKHFEFLKKAKVLVILDQQEAPGSR